MKLDLNQPIKIDLAKLRKLLEEKPHIVLGGAVLALAVGVAVFFAFLWAGKNDQPLSQAVPSAAESAPTVLPETRRPDTDKRAPAAEKDQARDPFAGPMALKGIIRGGANDTAIIEVGGATFVAGKGSLIADAWTVAEIGSASVTLKAGDQQVKLEFGGRSKSEKVQPGGAQEDKKTVGTGTDKREGGEVASGNAGNTESGR